MDLVATQLHGKDLTDIWDIPNPMKTLSTILVNENRGEPEARLLWASGKESLLACYHVGKEFCTNLLFCVYLGYFSLVFCSSTKGQIISECLYEIIVSPKIRTKKFPRFLP